MRFLKTRVAIFWKGHRGAFFLFLFLFLSSLFFFSFVFSPLSAVWETIIRTMLFDV